MRRLLVGLIRLFPREFRDRFGEEMRHQIDADYDRAAKEGRGAAVRFCLITMVDMAASALVERWSPTWMAAAAHSKRRANGRMTMGEWSRNLQHAARSLRRAPGFTAVTVCTLGLAIGVNAGIFSVVDAVLLEPLPFGGADDLVVIRGTAGADLDYNLAEEFYLQFRESAMLEDVAFWNSYTSSLRIGEETERAWMSSGPAQLFATLGAEPALGRLPTEDDSRTAVVLSHALWTSRFGADPDVIGRTIFASGADLTVIGVMGPDFFFPAEGVTLWIPIEVEPAAVVADVVTGGPSILARPAPGVSEEVLERELTRLARGLPERFGGSPAYARQVTDFRPLVRPLEEELLGSVRGPLWILFAAVGIVLFIACANVANLFAVRAEDRLRESAVRRALGAGRGRLMGSLFSEAIIVAGLAGSLAVLVAWVGVPLVSAAAPANVPRLAQAGLSPATLAFTALASALCALACGLLPAFRASAPDLARLRSGERGATHRRHWGRDALVAAQAALALVLLIGSGLLLQSFWSLSRVDPGYDTEDIFTFQIAPTSEELFDGPSYASFHLDFMERLRALPGVESVGIIENVPLNEGVASGQYVAEERAGQEDAVVVLSRTFASGEMFATMGIDLLEGRTFTEDDLELGLSNVMVSRSTVDLLWPGESPLGRRVLSRGTGTSYTVIGVVEDILQDDFRDAPLPMLYLPLVGPTATAWALSSPGYVMRTERAETIAPEVRALVQEVAPGTPMYRVWTMAGLAAESMIDLTFTTLMLGIVSTLALILGAIGLYGVLSYVVTRRRREIGVRMALGAQARRVRRMVVAQGARVVLVGVAVGLAVAVAATRVLEGLLFQVEPADAATFLTMSGALVAVGLLASYLPARRASSVDPIESLRSE